MYKNIPFLLFILLIISCDSSKETPSPKTTPIVDKSFYRVITTYRPATHVVLALRKSDNLVGLQDNGGEMPLFLAVNPRLQTLPCVGSKVDGINIETIVSLQPNLVVLYPGASKFSLPEKLQKFGIESFYLNVENFTEMQETFLALGEKMNAKEDAQRTITEMKRIFDLVQHRIEKNPPTQKKRVYITNSYNFFITHSKKMLQHEIITRAGCEDVSIAELGGWATISFEQLLVWNPDIIIVSGTFRQDLQKIANDPQYQNLQAIQNKQLYRMPHQKLTDWDYPGPDSVLAVLWLASIAYPDIFQDMKIEEQIEQYHQTLYGISVSSLIDKN